MARLTTGPAGATALWSRATALMVAGALAGCSNDSASPPVPDAMSVLAGDGQVALPGATLPESTIIRLVDIVGNPVPNYPIEWHLTVSGGKVSPASPMTDANGRVAALWTLSTTPGTQGLRVVATSSILRQLGATASPTAPTAFQIEGGNGQSGPVSQPLPTDPQVVVLDINGQPVKGVAVSWLVTGGAGRVSQGSSTTDNTGVAATIWTLGAAQGPQQLTASIRGLPAVVFSATATP
jgi:hypothetical protein